MNSTQPNGTTSTTISQSPSNLSAKIESTPRLTERDDPKTPVQRLLESEHIAKQTKVFLSHRFKQLDPFQLQKQMAVKIKHIIKNVIKFNEKNLNQN